MDRPTVLLVGTGERMKAALEAALERHSMMVESVSVDRAVEAAFAAAPDLLVLIGDAAADGGRAVLKRLGENPATATIPVVLLADETALDRRLDAFRHGVVAVVPRTASADGMARRVAELARELPERPGETAGELGEATVDELVELFSQQLRTGILSVSASSGEGGSAQVVLRAGRPVAEAIEELVARLRPLLAGATGPLRYEFHESTSARLTLFEPDESEPEDAALLKGRRIVLVEQNAARADVLVQELRARGALVVVVDGEGTGLERARAMDPEVVVIDGSGVHGWALRTLRALRRDPRLRWASLLVVHAADLWPAPRGAPDVERLASALKPLVRADRELAERAQREPVFDTRLEIIGPSRLLRALTATGAGLRLTVTHPRARVEVDLADGLVAGAIAVAPDGTTIGEGPGALAALLGLGSGRVHVERKDAPASANLMAPVDDALAAAADEAAPIHPSTPPPASEPPPSADREGPSRGADPERLVGRLEELLERLQKVLPAAEAVATRMPAAPAPARTHAIPPPSRSAISSASRRKTLAFGSILPPPAEHDDDLPVIEAIAEPSPAPAPIGPDTTRPDAPSVAADAAAALPQPTAKTNAAPDALAAPAQPSAKTSTAPDALAAPAQPVTKTNAAPDALAAPAQPTNKTNAAPDVLAPPPRSAAQTNAAPDVLAPPPRPATKTNAAPDVLAPPPRSPAPARAARAPAKSAAARIARSRGPLWFAGAFGLTLLVAGGAAAMYLVSRHAFADPPDTSAGGEETVVLPIATVPERESARATSAEPPRARGSASLEPSAPQREPAPSVAAATGAPSEAEPAAVAAGAPEAATDLTAAQRDEAPPSDDAADEPEPVANAADAPGTTASLAAVQQDEGLPSGDATDDELDEIPPDAFADRRERQRNHHGRDDLAHIIRAANFQRNQGNLRAAESHYMRALRIDNDNPRALAGLARLNLARRNTSAAVRWARRLVDASPRNAANHVLLGDAYEAAGNRRAAEQSWRRALELSPGLASARQRLAR